MDFQSVMETFAEAWVAANTQTPLTEAAEQGLITGSTAIGFAPSSGLSVLHDLSNDKREADSLTDSDSCRLPGRQSPTDSQNGCPTLGELRSPFKTFPSPHGKTMPVHCLVEQIPGPQACGQYVELDSFAIVPADALFSELVRTALVKLGYSVSQIVGAKGAIQIKKWKPLAFDQITENPNATVGDILGDLTTVATLHIRLYSVPDNPQEWIDTTVRNAVLELLREMSQSKLSKLCPLSQPMLSNIINNRYMGKIGKEKCQEFGLWYLNYRKQNPEGPTPEIVPSDRPQDGRLTFHPTKELPLMRDWFRGCRNPSRRTLQMYVDMLNQGSVRQQERPKVTLTTLKNWWKNEKQRERKNQKFDDGPKSAEKAKKKHKPDQISENEKDTYGSHLQELNIPEQQETIELNRKFLLVNHDNELESHELDRIHHKDGNVILHNTAIVEQHRINQSGNILLKSDIAIEENNIFHKLGTVCMRQNHGIFCQIPDSHLSENHHKAFSDIISNNIPTTVVSDETSNQIDSEEDVKVDI